MIPISAKSERLFRLGVDHAVMSIFEGCAPFQLLMKNLFALSILILTSNCCYAQTAPDLVGELGKKLGTTLTVVGVLVKGPLKGAESGPNLIVQMINDSVTQSFIQIPVSTEYGIYLHEPLPAMEFGTTYRFRAYETGAFVGLPADARREASLIIQATYFYFRNELMLISGVKIDPVEFSPASFVGRNALLSGFAKNDKDGSVIESTKWKLRLIGFRPWTESEIGKTAEVYGKIRTSKNPGEYEVENGSVRLVRLEDQLGKMVKLRGTTHSLNGHWWFDYRGTDVYVENLRDLENTPGDNDWRAMEVTGILETLSRKDQIRLDVNPNPYRTLNYIVRKASWVPIDALLAPEVK